jgi:mRNA interferase MazF
MAKGEIVLIIFPFSDLSGNKLRPSIVLAESKFEVTVCFITTQFSLLQSFDIAINPTQLNGLHKKSLIKVSKIATLEKALIKGVMGKVTNTELQEINNNLKLFFKI